MKLVLESTGGFAGVELSGELDTADLPEELARRVEEHLTSGKLRSADAKRSLPTPDARQYRLSLLPEDADGEVSTHVVDDTCADGEVLDVIDDLMAEIVRRKRAEGR